MTTIPTLEAAAIRIADGRLQPSSLLELVIDRISNTEESLHAYSSLAFDRARADAAVLDREAARGELRGALHGIPVGVKELFSTADDPPAAGGEVSDSLTRDAVAVHRLRSAGAVVLGSQVAHELGLGLDTPPTSNPWKLGHYPGGSTAGGGASVAAGSALAVIGTDAGGSVRKPAALCGVTGFKPSISRISRNGVKPPSGSLDHVGVLARTVRGCAMMFDALSEPLPARPSQASERSASATHSSPGIGGLRIGVPHEWLSCAEPDVAACFARAVETLVGAGARVVGLDLGDPTETQNIHRTIAGFELHYQCHVLLKEHPRDYSYSSHQAIAAAAAVSPGQYADAQAARIETSKHVEREMARSGADVICVPTTPVAAMSLEEFDPRAHLDRYCRFTHLFNLTGQPALSVPCGFSSMGLPVGIQFITSINADAKVLAVGEAYQELTSWHHQVPPINA